MGTLTSRGNFVKSDASEPADVAIYNSNMDRVHSESMTVPYTVADPGALDSYPGKIIIKDAGDPVFFLPDYEVYSDFWKLMAKGSWISYVPSVAFMTLGNGTLRGRYVYMGNQLWVEVLLIRGSTTVFESSGIGFSTPSGYTIRDPGNSSLAGVGSWMARVGGNLYKGRVNRRVTSVGVDLQPRKPTTTGSEAVTNTLPAAWATGDRIHLQCMAEVTR